MVKLVVMSGKKFCKLLENLGFEKIYGKGSHVRFKHRDGRRTVVPVHGNEDLGKGLLRTILNQIDLSKEEYDELRRKV
ncbi:type II toxin-antitoxin system HicA family toxin [archaeon]|jgi:predicted RNA binding protein YcfA (HicA-like mRNA interferase family)|nr:type II toxin-antitoxin system HicA family toxin [archaeon]MBT4241496.1 type II toxin-antitoxin system HicA family toxin [archaeon]MBT4417633.1 type II toxin-antitoxin system HicA family toxin [archaeon]